MRLIALCAALFILSCPDPGFAQAAAAGQANPKPPDQAKPQPPDPAKAQPPDPAKAQPPDPAQRPAPPTPGVRSGSISLGDMVTLGGYGSLRWEANNLDKPKPAGF